MQALAGTLQGFKRPDFTPEQWAEHNARCDEWQREQDRAKRSERLKRTGIPAKYAAARLEDCPPEIRAWAANPGDGLLLKGGFGVGKTHAACAILLSKVDEAVVRFTTMDALIRECKATFNGHDTEEAVISKYVNTRLLCLDDVGKERLTEWSLPIVFAIIDGRWRSGKPTIITTNYEGAGLLNCFVVNGDHTTADAIASRLMGYAKVTLDGEDRRLA